jgi:hypothetical protein
MAKTVRVKGMTLEGIAPCGAYANDCVVYPVPKKDQIGIGK